MYIKCKSKRIGGFRRCPAGGGDWNASPQEVSGAQLLFRLLIWVLVTWVCSFVKIRQNLCSLGNIFLNVNYILLKYLSNQKNLFLASCLWNQYFARGLSSTEMRLRSETLTWLHLFPRSHTVDFPNQNHFLLTSIPGLSVFSMVLHLFWARKSTSFRWLVTITGLKFVFVPLLSQ